MKRYPGFIPLLLTVLLAISLFGMVSHKAATTSFTHDESYTYNNYVTAPFAEIFNFSLATPNNHLLNTLLMKLIAAVFGPSELALRLPNLLAFAGFMIFVLLLVRKMGAWERFAIFALAVCNPYMLDFFALARGNGLSLCFVTGSTWFLAEYAASQRIRDYAGAVLLGFLAVLSHYTLLYFFLALAFTINLWFAVSWRTGSATPDSLRKPFIGANLFNLLGLAALVFILWQPLMKLTTGNQFYYGGETGFAHDTVGSLIQTFLYGSVHGKAAAGLLKVLVLLAPPVATALFFAVLFRKDREGAETNRTLFLLLLILLAMTLANMAHHWVTGTLFLIRRYALLYAPVFMLLAGHLLFIRRKGRLIPWLAWPGAALALALVLHTLVLFSSRTYLDWDYEKETRTIADRMEQAVAPDTPEGSVTMGITWLYEPTLNFYRVTRGLKWLKPVTRDGPGIAADWYYVAHDDLMKIPLRGALPRIFFDDGRTVLVRMER